MRLKRSKMFQLFMVCFGGIVFALGNNLFIAPMGFYNGGMVGFAQLIRTFLESAFGLNFGSIDFAGIVYYVLNVPIFLICYKKVGREFVVKSFLATTALTAAMTLIPIPSVPIIAEPVAACLIGGIISGAGTGLTLRYGASAGGTDMLGVYVIQRFNGMSVGKLSLMINAVVYGIMAVAFELPIAIYSIIYIVFLNITVDRVHLQVINVEVEIFTKKDPEKLKEKIFNAMYRGVTQWEARGGYTNEPGVMIYMIVNKFEVPLVRELAEEYDEHVFITFKEHVSVSGNFIRRMSSDVNSKKQ